MKRTKPNCNCVEMAEKANGGQPVKSYPCLAVGADDITALQKTQFRNQDQLQALVPDYKLEKAFEGTNFGPSATPRGIVKDTLLKIAGGFATGSTALWICQDLGLINSKGKLTKNGGRYLFYAYSTN